MFSRELGEEYSKGFSEEHSIGTFESNIELVFGKLIDEWSICDFFYMGIDSGETPKQETKPTFPKDVKFFYIGETREIKNHDGIITIASRVNEVGLMEYGVSYCSPKDKYVKGKGKTLAFDRMERDMYCVEFSKKTHYDTTSRILADVWAYNDFPNWAKPAIIEELTFMLMNV